MASRLATATIILGLAAIVVLVGIASIKVSQAQLSEEEARSLFEKLGCTACHVGNQPQAPALKWELILQELQKVQTEYGGDLDKFAQSIEYYGGRKFQSWQELIQQMAANVGRSPDDPEIKQIFEFFASYAGAAPAAPQETQTPAETPAETATPAPAPPAEETPKEAPKEEAKGIPFGLALAITIVIVAVVVGAIYMATRR